MNPPERDPAAASEQLGQRVRELEAIARVASNFTFEQPVEAMMAEVAREVVLANAHSLGCVVGEGDRETGLIARVLGSFGTPPGFQATLERAWRTAGTPLVSSSIQNRATQVFTLSEMLKRPGYEAVREAQQRAGWSGMAVVPMVFREVAIGLVLVFYPDGYLPGPPELSFLEAMANQSAVAVENARLFEQQREAAVTEERQRLSRELHDSVSQALFAISLSAQAARKAVENAPGKAVEPIEHIVSLSRIGLAEMRALIFDLRPEVLETEGLIAGLLRQTAALQARHTLEIETNFEVEPLLSMRQKEAVYRIAQEALQNVVRHARASKVTVSLLESGGAYVLAVEDNGQGFATDEGHPGHLGLVSMRERGVRAGGVVTIESSAGNGSKVTIVLPVGPAD